jgi:hypothetical protein
MSKTATHEMINMLMPAIHIHTHLALNPTKHFALNSIARPGYLFPLYPRPLFHYFNSDRCWKPFANFYSLQLNLGP